jgi:hypothetical protein
MRHRDEAGATQPRAGSDDVVVRDAGRVVDEHRCAGVEQPPQRLSGEFIARRKLDRAVADQRRHALALRCGERDRLHQPESRLREIT